MCSPFLKRCLGSLLVFTAAATATAVPATSQPAAPVESPQPRVLHVAADPNNLPFSNDRLEGFENKILQLVAADLGARVEYTWWAQRRGFFRQAVKHGDGEIVMGVPADMDRVLSTRPYYRSTYAFVYRKDAPAKPGSFDAPALRSLKIGVPLVGGNDNSPPAQALADRGLVDHLVGYSLYGDYREPSPTSRIVRDVADGTIDVAVVWGPLAGYFARRQPVPLEIVPVQTAGEPRNPFAYDICIGVKRSMPALRDEIDRVLARRQGDIDRILDEYNVPRAPSTGQATTERSDAPHPSH